MAFEILGIGGVLTFNDTQATKAMSRTSAAFTRVRMKAQRLQVGMQKIGAGIRSLGMVSIGSAIGLGIGAKAAIDFEHQMGAVAAVTRSTSAELKINSDYARKLGIETAYSATQAAQAMEVLGKFGLTKNALRIATKGVTDLAAAEGIDMAAGSKVMVGSLKAMNMSVKEASRAANVLALASASTEANVINLGESFAYAGSTLSQMNVSYEMSTALFSALAGKMMRGSRAGTGMMALMRGLQGSSGKARKAMEALGINIQQFGGDMRRMPAIIEHISQKLDKKYTNPIKKAAAVTDIFGRFGQVAFFNLAQTGRKRLEEIYKSLTKAGTAFKDKFGKPLGAAAWMAQQRLNTVKGAITLFKSSLESFFITIFQMFLGPMKNRLKEITKHFNNVLFAMQALEGDDSIKNQTKLVAKYGRTTMQVALGVRDGLKLMQDAWRAIGRALKDVGAMFGRTMGKDTLRTVIKYALGFTMILASMAPLFIALLGMKMLFGAIASIAVGAFIVIKAAALPLLAVLGLIAGTLVIMRNEGESLGQTAMRILSGIASAVMSLYNNAIKPLFTGIWSVIRAFTVGMSDFWGEVAAKIKGHILGVVSIFKRAVKLIISILKPIFSIIKAMILKMRPMFKAWIRFGLAVYTMIIKIGKALMSLAETVGGILKSIIAVLKPMLIEIAGIFSSIITWIYNLMRVVVKAVGWYVASMIDGLKKILRFLKPIFVRIAKMVVLFYRIGRVIAELILTSFRVMYSVIKKIVTLVWEKLKPAWPHIADAITKVLGVIMKVGKAIETVMLAPLRKLAGMLAKVLAKLESVAGVIPGMSKENIKKLRRTLEEFSGLNIIVAGRMGPTRMRRAPRVALRQVTRAQAAMEGREAVERARYRERKEALAVTIKDKRQYNFKSTTSIDGRCVAAASARHRVEIEERAGYGTTPWQRRAVILRAADVTPSKAR